MKMTLTFPVKGTIAQGFGGNGTNLYASQGLIGHTGIDLVSFYGDVITDCVRGFNTKWVYSFLNKDNPDLSKYRAVCQIVEADDGVFEIIYGHCNTFLCPLGPTTTGQALATEGNTGDVFVGGVAISKAEREQGSTKGFHVHFQVRRLKKSKVFSTPCLVTEDNTPVKKDGFYYLIPQYDNGFNGCIDPMQFIGLQINYQFFRDLAVGSFGTDVRELQKRLVKLGFGFFRATGFFGSQTRQAVIEYQLANNIDPIGRCGPLTRLSLNQ